jgi:hypothetical protein
MMYHDLTPWNITVAMLITGCCSLGLAGYCSLVDGTLNLVAPVADSDYKATNGRNSRVLNHD